MKRTILTIAIIALLAIIGVPTFAQCSDCSMAAVSATKTTPTKTAPKSAMCPITGAKISDISAAPKSVCKGKTYYFCYKSCKAMFDKNPAKYLKSPKKQIMCPGLKNGKCPMGVAPRKASSAACAGKNCVKCPMNASSAKAVSAVCPVMGNKIADVSKAAGKSVYKGKTYYFCCAGCKPKFDKNPEKYAGKR